MKILLLLFMIAGMLNANVYYSKVEPFDFRRISSNVVGLVTFVDKSKLGKNLQNNKPYIKIDAQLDRAELLYINEKLDYLRETVKTNEKILINLEESLKKKRINYEKVKEMKIKSSVEKDREFYDLVASENSYLSIIKEINSLKRQITDIKLRKAQLKRSIEDKNLSAKGYTLYSLNVKVGQVVNRAAQLATVADTSKAILTIYLNIEDVPEAQKKVVYIDGEKTSFRVDRLIKIADSKNISKYKAQIIIPSPEVFSKLVKVELKDQ